MHQIVTVIIAALLLPHLCFAESYSKGPTINKILMAQESMSITPESVVDLRKSGFLLLINSVRNGGEKKWLYLSEKEEAWIGEEIKKFDKSVIFRAGIPPIQNGSSSERPVWLRFSILKIFRNEAICQGDIIYSLDTDPLNKTYEIKFRLSDGVWNVVSLDEEKE